MVFLEFVMACRLSASPTNRSPVLVKATTDGVIRRPSEFSRTTGSPPSITAMHEFVVPKSMPITFAIKIAPGYVYTKIQKYLSSDGATCDVYYITFYR